MRYLSQLELNQHKRDALLTGIEKWLRWADRGVAPLDAVVYRFCIRDLDEAAEMHSRCRVYERFPNDRCIQRLRVELARHYPGTPIGADEHSADAGLSVLYGDEITDDELAKIMGDTSAEDIHSGPSPFKVAGITKVPPGTASADKKRWLVETFGKAFMTGDGPCLIRKQGRIFNPARDPKTLTRALVKKFGIQRSVTAIHECAHAAIADAYAAGSIEVEMYPAEQASGMPLHGLTTVKGVGDWGDTEHVALDMAGRLGEIAATRVCALLANSDGRHGSSSIDNENTDLRISAYRDKHGDAMADEMKAAVLTRTRRFVERNLDRIVLCAGELLRAGRLNADETKAALWVGIAPELRRYRTV